MTSGFPGYLNGGIANDLRYVMAREEQEEARASVGYDFYEKPFTYHCRRPEEAQAFVVAKKMLAAWHVRYKIRRCDGDVHEVWILEAHWPMFMERRAALKRSLGGVPRPSEPEAIAELPDDHVMPLPEPADTKNPLAAALEKIAAQLGDDGLSGRLSEVLYPEQP